MIFSAILLAVAVAPSQMAALIGNDRVTATYPGFRRTPGDVTALAASGPTRPQRDGYSLTDSIVIRKIASLPAASAAEFDLQAAQNLAFGHVHTPWFAEELARTVLGQETTSVCSRGAYGFVVSRKIRMHEDGGKTDDWTQAEMYVLTLVGRDVWEATYTRAYTPDADHDVTSLIRFTSNFCVQQNYRKYTP